MPNTERPNSELLVLRVSEGPGDGPGAVTVGPNTTPADILDRPLGGRVSIRHTPAGMAAEFGRVVCDGQAFHATLWFDASRLARIELMAIRNDDGSSWSDWSLEKELTRKRGHEAWLGVKFGRTPTVEPFMLDGRPVLPFAPDDEHPRTLDFEWGRAGSYYDSKAGMALICISFGRPDRTGDAGGWGGGTP